MFFYLHLQYITNADIEEPPLYVPLHHFEGLLFSTSRKFTAKYCEYGYYFSCRILAIIIDFILCWMCLWYLNNLVDYWFKINLADHKEQEVKSLDLALTPPDKVQVAIDCLPTTLQRPINGTKPSFNRWTIMDYFRAYSSGDITPHMVLLFHLLRYFFIKS